METTYQLIDTHVHLEHDAFRDDLDAILERGRDAAVAYFVVPACEAADAARALEIARTHAGVFFAAGLHPNNGLSLGEKQRRGIRDALVRGREEGLAVAVGECGLDYHYMGLPSDEQKAVLRWHFGLARELELPVILHQREAREDLQRVLEEEGVPPRGGVLHCFGGDDDYYVWARRAGLHVSFTGSITFVTKKAAAPAFDYGKIDLGAAMLESDAPYMTPAPYRGRRNEPARLPLVAAALAAKEARSLDDVYAETTLTARSFFGLPPRFGGAISYLFKDALYLNVTNRCTNDCVFCLRKTAHGVGGYDLRLTMEPSAAEVLGAVGDASAYKEVVFCGYGEPTVRWESVMAVARAIKAGGGRVRLNTNGSANVTQGRDVTPEMAGVFDAVSVSVVAPAEEPFLRLCRPKTPGGRWAALETFVLGAKKHVPAVEISGVAGGFADEAGLATLAARWGVPLRMRPFVK